MSAPIQLTAQHTALLKGLALIAHRGHASLS